MATPSPNDKGPRKAMAWLTDEEFGYDHWRAAQFSCGRGTKFAVIQLFDSEEERDAWWAKPARGHAGVGE